MQEMPPFLDKEGLPMTDIPCYSADCKRISNAARVARRVWIRTGDAQTAMLALDGVISEVDKLRKERREKEERG
ncbi:MAG: hypothetical protein CMK96_06375 [Pseudomonas sp.]|nr:hypothetical protein [Pseudomonas sp.]